MNQAITQIKISLPVALKNEVKKRADKWGMTLASYIKYLMVNKVEEEYPTFEASDRVKKRVADSLSGKSKSIKIDNIDEYFAKLKSGSNI
ncbi:hypothetical protein HYV64_04895 [Candidatus Shapirobacteria bacterium]|nr:hypothetical protein [Candidatus Shapirobacteria bacterium]